MSTVDREPIWAALFALLKSKLGSRFKIISRKHRLPGDDFGMDFQPALFLVQGLEDETGGPYGANGALVLHGFLILYDYDRAADEPIGAETSLMATTLNGHLKAIGEALAPGPAYEAQTLLGLVEHCWIDGTTAMDQGILGKQAFAQIPIHISVA